MKLKQYIGKKTLLVLTLNAILGTGIFFLPAVGAAYSGTSSLISWAIMSLVAVMISLYFAELVSMFPRAGGAYEFVKQSFGRSPAFVFGWLSWIVANITISMLVVGSIKYLLPAAGLAEGMALAVLFIAVFNAVSYRGIDFSTKMLLFFGILTVASIAVLIVPGLSTMQMANFSTILSASPAMILLTVYFISETFFGWETATYMTEEVKNARKVLPKMLVISTVIISAISLLLVFVALGNFSAGEFGAQGAPLAYMAGKFFGGEAGNVFALIIFIPLIGTAASWIVSSPRLLFAMARDRVLVPRLGKVHKKYRTPHNAILFQTAVTIVLTLVAFGDYLFLLAMLVPLVIIMYSLVMLSAIKLRMDRPRAKRYFNAPFPKTGPMFVIVFMLLLLYMWLTTATGAVYVFSMGLLLVLLGVPLYIIIRLQVDKKFTEKFYDRIAPVWDRMFRVWYGAADAERIVKTLKINKESNVLDFGCGSGTTTTALAEKAKNVIAVDLSEKQMNRAIKKIGAPNVIFVKGDRRFPRNSFDAVTAVGVLEFTDRPQAYVAKMIDCLKPGGRFYFLSFGKSFGIPAPDFVKQENIEKLFKNRKVTYKTERVKKRFTEYVHIYGVKK